MTAALFAAAWVLGIACAAWAPAGVASGVTIAGAAPVWFTRGRSPRAACLALSCAGIALLGAWRGQMVTDGVAPTSAARFAGGGPVLLTGVVAAPPDERERHQRLRVQARWIERDGHRAGASGGVLVRIPLGRRPRAGDVVEVEGTLELPAQLPGFDYRAYLARQGIDAEMAYPRLRRIGYEPPPAPVRMLHHVRQAVVASLNRALPQPEGALAAGILTGVRSAIPRDLTDDFNASGTSHLIAISGYNVALLAGAVMSVLAGLIHRRWAALIAALVITSYAIFAGLSASVARALIMGLLLIWVDRLGRPSAPLVSLSLAAALMTGHDPRILDDLGFQLSFAATAGIMLLQPVLHDAGRGWIGDGDGWGRAALRAAQDTVSVTLAATVATLPVMLHAFGRVSLVSVPANLLAAPLFPVVLLTSGLAALWGLLWPPAAVLGGMVAWAPLTMTIAIARGMAALPMAQVSIPAIPGWGALVLGAGLGLLLMWLRHSRRAAPAPPDGHSLRISPLLVASALVLAALALNLSAVIGGRSDTGRLEVVFAEAGGAPIALVTGPQGERVLVDTGPSPAALARAVDPLLPVARRQVDLVLLTRTSSTSSGGLAEAVERYRPAASLAPEAERDATGGAIATMPLTAGSVVHLSRGARIEVDEPQERGGRLRLTAVWGERRIALTPDTSADAGPFHQTGAPPGVLAVALAEQWLPAISVREQGPVRLSTDGARLRLSPARGPLPALSASTAGRGTGLLR